MSVRIFILISFVWLFNHGCRNSTHDDPVALSHKYAPSETVPVPRGTDIEQGLALYAKVICSAVFVSERDPEEALKNSGYFLLENAGADLELVSYDIDYEEKRITMTYNGDIQKVAHLMGDQGCVLDVKDGPFFKPVNVVSSLPHPDSMFWPMGDRLPVGKHQKPFDINLLEKAVNMAFDPPDALTTAFIVLHQGNIIAERYSLGVDKNTQLESWSMGKSLTATLIGRMIQEGFFELDDPAPVKEWAAKGDPRAAIRIRDLLQMSSGLQFTAHRDPEVATYDRYLDHMYIYTGGVDAFQYSVRRPLQFPIGTEGRYRNCDPLTLGYIMRTKLTEAGYSYWMYPQEALFDKIGIRRQVLETDPYGNFLLSGFDYGTARNWARLGQLYLQDGMWMGERLLPEGFVKFVSSPAPGWKEPIYGGLFWLNNTNEYPLPDDAFIMAGAGGQRTIIIPSLELVIVRMGHHRGANIGNESLKEACQTIVHAFR